MSTDRALWHIVAACSVGVAAFYLIVGHNVLDTANIAWLTRGDAQQHYLGWAFFRQAPLTSPIGTNPGFGMELSSTIVYSDSNPLFAILFKQFESHLGETFQYFGLWLLLCFVAQAVFSYLLVGLYTDHFATRLLCTAFFATALPMINRITANTSNVAHLSLVGHFFIVAALYLYLKEERARDRVFFVLLLSTATAVHAYLAALVAVFWLGSLARSMLRGKIRALAAIANLAVGLGAAILVAWQAGYFGVGSDFVALGFGIFNLNLLAPIASHGWSHVLPHIGSYGGDYEGFAYLGIGVLGLLGLALFREPGLLRDAWSVLRQDIVLCAILVSLTLFAIANTLAIGPFGVTFPIPSSVKEALVFRSSGRMIWPVYYLVLLGILVAIVRLLPPPRATWVLSVALVVQLLDTNAVWGPVRAYLNTPPKSQWDTPLQHPFWTVAANRYKAIRTTTHERQFPEWYVFADLAQRHNLPTDIVFVARFDHKALERRSAALTEFRETGRFPQDELFVFPDGVSDDTASVIDTTRHLVATIDGYTVLAPDWMNCESCLQVVSP